MNKTWTSGAVELLDHAIGHLKQEAAFDKRIAFISIDNAVEITIKTFLCLPKQFFGDNRPSRKELDDAFNSFTSHLSLLYKYAEDKLIGIHPGDIEHYHRIRNTLYHDGTGLAVDQQYIDAYLTIAKLLLKRLFDTELSDVSIQPTLESIITGWNKIEEYLYEILDLPSARGKYPLAKALQDSALPGDMEEEVKSLRQERNKLVHSSNIDGRYIKSTHERIQNLIEKLSSWIRSNQDKIKGRNYFFEPEKSIITGTLAMRQFFGPPGYGETPEMDMIENVWILDLDRSINVHWTRKHIEHGDFKASKFNISSIQLHTTAHNVDLSPYKGKRVSLKGELWEAHTGHHFTPALLTVQEVGEPSHQ